MLDDYACLVGPNGAGKSTVLTALNVFFRETETSPLNLSQLQPEDFHRKNTSDPIEITVTFTGLSQAAEHDLSDYVRHGRLIVSAVAHYDNVNGKAIVKQYGQRLGIPAFSPYFEAVKKQARVADLKTLYKEIREQHTGLPEPGVKDAMTKALHEYESARRDECEPIPSEDQFYGFTKGANRLSKHVQWVYIPAVKDASSEQIEARNTALGKLLARTVRQRTNFRTTVGALQSKTQEEYQSLLDESQHVLDELSSTLQMRISEWAHPDARIRLQWKQDPERSVRVEEPLAHILAGEAGFEGELARFGHGLQRSYLLALLQELSGTDDAAGPCLILACEEPELYQHPPQARHLAMVLNSLSQGKAQVIVTTHDPRFVTGSGFEDVRVIRKDPCGLHSSVSQATFEEVGRVVSEASGGAILRPEGVLLRVHQALQPSLGEMFFTNRLVLVEGLEDVAYLMTYISLMEKIKDFRRLGCHIIATQGKSALVQPLAISRVIGIPTYVIFDSDADKPDKHGSRTKHERDNRALLALLDHPNEEAMPTKTVSGPGFTMWHSDIGSVVESEIGSDEWRFFQQRVDEKYGNIGRARKHALHIGDCLTTAWLDGRRSPALERVCEALLEPDRYAVSQASTESREVQMRDAGGARRSGLGVRESP